MRKLSTLLALVALSLVTQAHADPPPPKTDLSKKAATLKLGMSRPAVVRTLGKPTWVFLPGDKSDFAPDRTIEEALVLVWNNSPCDPVVMGFGYSLRLESIAGGSAYCADKGPYKYNPKKGKFSCKEKKRSKYCRF